jgi:sulfur-carrier protein
MIRVVLPAHLRTLAQVSGEVQLEVPGPVTQRAVLDALEARYPMLQGTLRDHVTQQRRAFVRFFACEEDWSHASPDAPLPEAVAAGAEPFLVIGAIAGGAGRPYLLPNPTKNTPTRIRKTPMNFARVNGSLKKIRDHSSVKM